MLPGIGPRLWLGGAVHTRTHNDRDHNLACVIAGKRRFVLFPPEQVTNLYVGPPDNPPPLSLVDPEAPDLARFPRYVDAIAAARVAFLEPGEALFMPRYWWHHVASLDPYNAMVNYWWGGSDTPNDAFLTALLAFRDLPSGERDYWREMIAAYVFGERGDTDLYRFMARSGETLLIEVDARKLDSFADPLLRVRDAAGKVVGSVDDADGQVLAPDVDDPDRPVDPRHARDLSDLLVGDVGGRLG